MKSPVRSDVDAFRDGLKEVLSPVDCPEIERWSVSHWQSLNGAPSYSFPVLYAALVVPSTISNDVLLSVS